MTDEEVASATSDFAWVIEIMARDCGDPVNVSHGEIETEVTNIYASFKYDEPFRKLRETQEDNENKLCLTDYVETAEGKSCILRTEAAQGHSALLVCMSSMRVSAYHALRFRKHLYI